MQLSRLTVNQPLEPTDLQRIPLATGRRAHKHLRFIHITRIRNFGKSNESQIFSQRRVRVAQSSGRGVDDCRYSFCVCVLQ